MSENYYQLNMISFFSHCYLIEPLSGQFHMRSLVTSRFLGFISRIRKSKKDSLRSKLKTIEYDIRERSKITSSRHKGGGGGQPKDDIGLCGEREEYCKRS